MVTITRSAMALLAFSGIVLAAPTSQVDPLPNMAVLIRNSTEGSFHQSTKMADKIRSEIRSGFRSIGVAQVTTEKTSILPESANVMDGSREVLDVLEKRATIWLSYCTNSGCTQNCQDTISSFSSNFCLNVPGTQCIIIHDLTNAKIRYWNRQGCNGNESVFTGCGITLNLPAPGTNSIGFQLNCT